MDMIKKLAKSFLIARCLWVYLFPSQEVLPCPDLINRLENVT
ncbi:hypothetical protein CHISP_1997 [Chitinispirillum alkaliphilum]|nr:hypothetical protein CHISP_1997 [Chitinispirillum alkaliphilum]